MRNINIVASAIRMNLLMSDLIDFGEVDFFFIKKSISYEAITKVQMNNLTPITF